MNFKDALIAHLQGEKVELKEKGSSNWESFEKRCAWVKVAHIDEKIGSACEFRLKPRTITVNGREVPEPVMQTLSIGTKYFVPCVDTEELYLSGSWSGYDVSFRRLKHGLVHLTKEAAIAHAKAMLNID